MKRRFPGRSCLLMLLLGGSASLVILFVASVIFNQAQAGAQKAEATLPAVVTTAPPRLTATQGVSVTASAPLMGVTIEFGPTAAPAEAITNASATATSEPGSLISATPGLAPLGTLGNPLTVTAEAFSAATKVARFLNRVDATRTANAQEAETAHATLTAAASQK